MRCSGFLSIKLWERSLECKFMSDIIYVKYDKIFIINFIFSFWSLHLCRSWSLPVGIILYHLKIHHCWGSQNQLSCFRNLNQPFSLIQFSNLFPKLSSSFSQYLTLQVWHLIEKSPNQWIGMRLGLYMDLYSLKMLLWAIFLFLRLHRYRICLIIYPKLMWLKRYRLYHLVY